ncbi:hypothetical protein LCGC14_0563730 [marine sediment metagenome]|uniref:GTP-binding protein n=1 Tax=marine sediment metagenome TaxID=412755 RepID=A0A0F9S4X3_9ZZZZ|nr:MAG: small GTP-binding domain protein [Candidatus Lokiarchaeum sp. GC14_75]
MSTELKSPLLFRISILGDEGIGKDKFINLFTTNQFLKESDTGLGVAFYKGSIMLDTERGQQECIIWIWDLKEREGYKSLHSRYLKGTNGIMLFFDLTNRQSFDNLPNWINKINNQNGFEVPILLVGNREDSKKFVVSPNELNKFIRKFNLFYIETSLTTNEGVYDSFYCITSLSLGIEVNHEYFLSKNIIYYPSSAPITQISTSPLLTSQDLSNLSQKAIFKKIESLEKTFEKSTQIKVPLKRLVTEVVLSIGVVIMFIIVHFLYNFESDKVCFPTQSNCFYIASVAMPLFVMANLMQIIIIIPIIVTYIKHR